jgi:hypothetical protein
MRKSGTVIAMLSWSVSCGEVPCYSELSTSSGFVCRKINSTCSRHRLRNAGFVDAPVVNLIYSTYIKSKVCISVCMYVRCLAMRSFVGSVARQRPVGNNGVVFSLGSVLRTRFRGNIVLLIIIKYKIPGALSPRVKLSRSEAEIQPELQKGEVVRSSHA